MFQALKILNNKLTRKNKNKNQICFIYKNGKIIILNKTKIRISKISICIPYMLNSHEQRKFKIGKVMDRLS